jgi:hypothetical protein
LYREPVKEELVARRVREIKEQGARAVLSFTQSVFIMPPPLKQLAPMLSLFRVALQPQRYKVEQGSDFDLSRSVREPKCRHHWQLLLV